MTGAEVVAIIGFLIAHEGDIEAAIALIRRAVAGEAGAVERIDTILAGEGYAAGALKAIKS